LLLQERSDAEFPDARFKYRCAAEGDVTLLIGAAGVDEAAHRYRLLCDLVGKTEEEVWAAQDERAEKAGLKVPERPARVAVKKKKGKGDKAEDADPAAPPPELDAEGNEVPPPVPVAVERA
jgi:hypothetical protein